MKCRAFPTDAALAETLARSVIDTIVRRPNVVLGLPTGRTPLALYQQLTRISAAEGVDWAAVRTFNLDEFVGRSSDDEGSYRRFMQQRLFSHVNVQPQNIGFNEPADTLVARTHRITLDSPTRAANALWFGGDLTRVPHEALTMGMGTILRARSVILIATGETKADAVRAMLYGGVTTQVPASFLQLHAQVSVMLDQLLADQLP